jgi:hypothetical protein
MLGLHLLEKSTDEMLQELARDVTAELHPDLVYHLNDGFLGPQLQHPLVYQVPLISNGHANAQYAWKTGALKKAEEEKNWDRYVFLHERPHRIHAFQTIMRHFTNAEYWRIFGEVWTDTENLWQNKADFKRLLNSKRPNREAMMTEEEIEYMDKLPHEFTVYRGCRKNLNENGMSWTLDYDKAQWFMNRLNRFGDGKILEATIPKHEIYAVFLGRGETEVVWYKRRNA